MYEYRRQRRGKFTFLSDNTMPQLPSKIHDLIYGLSLSDAPHHLVIAL